MAPLLNVAGSAMADEWRGSPTAQLIAECLRASLHPDDTMEDVHNLSMLGIDELRSTDPALAERQLWHCDGGDAKAGRLVRFGSLQERTLHNAMRLLALVELFFTPFVVAFDAVYPLRCSPTVLALDLLFTVCYTLGVLSRLRTTFVDVYAVECTDLREIQRQVRQQADFRADCLALLCSPALYLTGPLWPLSGLRLLKCWRLHEKRERLILLSSMRSSHTLGGMTSDFLQIVVGVLAAMHIYGCIWFMAKVTSPPAYGREWSAWNGWSKDVFEAETADSGSLSIPIEPGDLSDLGWCYIRALRDGAYMLVGWSGPNALSIGELFVVCILGPSGACIMACVYGFVVATISQARILESRFQERADVLNKACQSMHLPAGLRARINHYHSYMELLCLGTDAQSLFAQLSPNLTCEMRMYRMRGVLSSASIFQGLEPRVSLMLAQTCIEQVFAPGDMVVRKGEIGDCMYIILKGSVAVLVDDAATKIVMRLGEAECFGELCLLRESMQRTAWIRAQTFCVLWRLDKARVDALLGGRKDLQQKVYSRILTKVGRFMEAEDLKVYLADLNIRSRSLAAQCYAHFDSDNVTFPGDRPLTGRPSTGRPFTPEDGALHREEERSTPLLHASQGSYASDQRRTSHDSQHTEVYYTHNGVETDESTPLMSDRDDSRQGDGESPRQDDFVTPSPFAAPLPKVPAARGPPPRARRVSVTESLTGGLVESMRGTSFPHIFGGSMPVGSFAGRRHSIAPMVQEEPGPSTPAPPAADTGQLQAQMADLTARMESIQGMLTKSVIPRLSRIEAALPAPSAEKTESLGN